MGPLERLVTGQETLPVVRDESITLEEVHDWSWDTP